MSKNKIYLSEFIDDLSTLHRFVEYVEIDDLKNYFSKYSIGKAPFEEEEVCSFYDEKTNMCHCLATVRKCYFCGDVDKCLIDRSSKLYEQYYEIDKEDDTTSDGKCVDYHNGKCYLSADGVPCECRCSGKMDNCLDCFPDDDAHTNCKSCVCKNETNHKKSEEQGEQPQPPCKYKAEDGYCKMTDGYFCNKSDWHECRMFDDRCKYYDETLETCTLNGKKCKYWGDNWMCEINEEEGE